MTNIDAIELKEKIDMSTGRLLLLTVATAGFYAYYWLLKNNSIIGEVTKKHLASSSYMLTLIGTIGWGQYFGGIAGNNMVVATLGLILLLSGAVMSIIWSFRAKDALCSYAAVSFGIDYKMNAFYTFIFQYFYISYCINELPEEQARLRNFIQYSARSDSPA